MHLSHGREKRDWKQSLPPSACGVIKIAGGNETDGFTNPQKVMDGYIVNWKQPKTGETGSWEYPGIKNEELKTTQTIKYWDYSATSYRYFAFQPRQTQR